jgi:hypothetical protein
MKETIEFDDLTFKIVKEDEILRSFQIFQDNKLILSGNNPQMNLIFLIDALVHTAKKTIQNLSAIPKTIIDDRDEDEFNKIWEKYNKDKSSKNKNQFQEVIKKLAQKYNFDPLNFSLYNKEVLIHIRQQIPNEEEIRNKYR